MGISFFYDGKYHSLPSHLNPLEVNLDETIVVIEASNKKATNQVLREIDKNTSVLKGRYGPYIRHKTFNIPLRNIEHPEKLTKAEIKKIIDEYLKTHENKPSSTSKRKSTSKKK